MFAAAASAAIVAPQTTYGLKTYVDSPYILPATIAPIVGLSDDIVSIVSVYSADAPNLIRLLRQVFGAVTISFARHVDPEEGWSKIVLGVDSGIADSDKRFALEDSLFAAIDADDLARHELGKTIISFV
jgi:hypothetical protein